MSQLRVLAFKKSLIPNIYASLSVTVTGNILHLGLTFFIIILLFQQIPKLVAVSTLFPSGKAKSLVCLFL